jgi:hypothetical protein
MLISMQQALAGLVLCILGLAMFYVVRRSEASDQWWLPWTLKAGVAACIILVLGMQLLGLPGAFFVEIVMGLRGKLPLDISAWPLAILITQVGSLMIVPASLALRFIRPNIVGWQHVMATTLLTFAATLFFTILVTALPNST